MDNEKLLKSPGGVKLPSDDEMEKMGWDDLYSLRLKNRGNKENQAAIAPYEHQAYAREEVAKNPIIAPAFATLPIGYQVAKLVRATDTDDMSTPPSLKQMVHGLKGIIQGAGIGIKNAIAK